MRKLLRNSCCIVALTLGITATYAANDDSRLMIFSSQTKGEIEAKMKSNKWASETLKEAHSQVDKYVETHLSDTTWVISRLQMYWKNHYTQPYINGGNYSRAEGEAPVPTVRFTGARDWASDYATPSLENTIPYMDYRDDQIYLQNTKKKGQPWEWVNSSDTAHQIETINARIIEKAMYAAFIYWLGGEEKYAKFAYDIMMTYIDGMYYRKAPISEVDHRNAHLVGLTSFEVIHERVLNYLPLCYDFLAEYTKEQGGDIDRIHTVFKMFAEQIIEQGVAYNNWNVFQACFITYIALALNDDSAYEDGRGKQYYIDFILNQNVPRQKALRDVCKAYDQETGMWHESPGYSIATTKDLIEIILLIDGMDDSGDILTDFSIVEKATLSSFEYLHPNLRTSAFGDNQYMTIDHAMSESLLALYRKHKMTDKERLLSAVINDQIKAGIYDREKGSSLYKLFNYVDRIDPEATSDDCIYSTLLYAPNVNLAIQRNGMDKTNGLMISNAGTGFNHCNNNGINMELYGKGYVLGIDKARGSSYWHKDHAEYYNATISHNTVLIDGVSSNGSPRMEEGERSKHHKLVSHFPEVNQKDANTPYALSYVDNEYFEEGTATQQRRVNGIIRTSPTSGYYVDIFRSAKRDGGDKRHEYIYHNAGQSLSLYDKSGKKINMTASNDLTSEGGFVKGYDYLSDRYEAEYDGDFRGTFEINMEGDKGSVNMDVWMKGYDDRKLFSVMTPRALKGFGGDMGEEIESAPIPALIVRQSGEAWDRPFVAIYEPYTVSEGKTIESVEYLNTPDSDLVAIEVESHDGAKQYILNSTTPTENHSLSDIDVDFAGAYGVVSMQDEKISYLFLGSGQSLSFGNYGITSNSCGSILVEWCSEGMKVKADVPFTLTMAKKGSPSKLSYVDCKGTAQTIKGKAQGKSIVYTIPAMDDTMMAEN